MTSAEQNGKRRTRWGTVAGLLALMWMLIIFGFSAQPSEESTEVSFGLTVQIVTNTSNLFHLDWNNETIREMSLRLEHTVRKIAHMTEYGILAIFLLLWVRDYVTSDRMRYGLPMLISGVYAASDEIHQLFVPGRSGKVTDVLIDSAGAALALLLCYFIRRIKERSAQKRAKQDL